MSRPYRIRVVSTASRAYSRDPRERVEAIGGVNSDRTHWRLSQEAAIAAIEAGTDEFSFAADGLMVKLTVLSHDGQKYLASERTSSHPDDLLTLVSR